MNFGRHAATIAAALFLACAVTSAEAATLTYDAALGSLPEAQGWTFIQDGALVPVPTVISGVLNQGPTDFSGHQYWTQSSVGFDFTAGPVTLDARLLIVTSSFHPFGRGGYNFVLADNAGRIASLYITGASVFLGNDALSSISSVIGFDTTDAFHDYRLAVDASGSTLSIDGNVIVSLGLGGVGEGSGPEIYFGDATILGNSQSQLTQVTVKTVPEPTSIALLGLGLLGTAAWRRRRVRSI